MTLAVGGTLNPKSINQYSTMNVYTKVGFSFHRHVILTCKQVMFGLHTDSPSPEHNYRNIEINLKTKILHIIFLFSAVTQLISAFVFATQIVQIIQNIQPLAIFCDCTVRFVSGLFVNHIFHEAAHYC